jgi:diguanylate cyclase (GGDEF)-like protein
MLDRMGCPHHHYQQMNLRSITQLHPIIWLSYRPAISAAIILFVFVLLSWRAGELQRQRELSDKKAMVQTELANFRSELENRIYVNLALVRSLSIGILLRGDLSAEELAVIGEELQRNIPYQRSLAVAPDFVVRHVFPIEGNQRTLGLNLLEMASQKKAMYRAIQLDDAFLAGPLDSTQGGNEVILRLPIWVRADGVPRLWGAVSSTMDLDALLQASGLQNYSDQLNITIRGVDASGPAGDIFVGKELNVSNDAVRMPIFVPGGSWLMAAEPLKGFEVKSWWANLAGIVGLALSALFALATYRILNDRSRIRHLANHDPLTALANRRKALVDLKEFSEKNHQSGDAFALLSIDLDGFKPINDRYGHDMGDEVLIKVAQRLKSAVRSTDRVARMGGDEFLVMVADVNHQDQSFLLKYAQRLREVLSEPMSISASEQSVYLGASIGIAAYPRSANDIEALMEVADQAMYRAKREKTKGIEFAATI